jgi:hypothetical protein
MEKQYVIKVSYAKGFLTFREIDRVLECSINNPCYKMGSQLNNDLELYYTGVINNGEKEVLDRLISDLKEELMAISGIDDLCVEIEPYEEKIFAKKSF